MSPLTPHVRAALEHWDTLSGAMQLVSICLVQTYWTLRASSCRAPSQSDIEGNLEHRPDNDRYKPLTRRQTYLGLCCSPNDMHYVTFNVLGIRCCYNALWLHSTSCKSLVSISTVAAERGLFHLSGRPRRKSSEYPSRTHVV
jgi:hypothetical protein